jgi:predicted RNase H-like HicB family nuclease
MKRFAVVIEKATNNYGAYVPDLPGCIATGQTVEETLQQIQEAIEFHLEGMGLHGERIPEPSSLCQYIEVDVSTTSTAIT